MKWLVNICRIVVALTFIFSGFVKAIDPLGTQYKIEDYLEALSLAQHVPSIVTLGTSVLLSAMEFCLGIFLLFAIHRRSASKISFAFMVVMTLITLWLWIAKHRIACLYGGHCLATSDDDALHQPLQPVDCGELYGAIHFGFQHLEPMGATTIRLPPLPRGSQYTKGNGDSRRG